MHVAKPTAQSSLKMAGERVLASLAARILHYENLTDKMENKRKFDKVTEKDTTDIIEAQKNRNTLRKTNSDMHIFTTWLREEKEDFRQPENIMPEELDKLIAMFILAVKQTGTSKEFEPDIVLVSSVGSQASRISRTRPALS